MAERTFTSSLKRSVPACTFRMLSQSASTAASQVSGVQPSFVASALRRRMASRATSSRAAGSKFTLVRVENSARTVKSSVSCSITPLARALSAVRDSSRRA